MRNRPNREVAKAMSGLVVTAAYSKEPIFRWYRFTSYRKPAEPTVHRLINKLKQHYNLEGGNDLQWFLGIRILRDRERGLRTVSVLLDSLVCHQAEWTSPS